VSPTKKIIHESGNRILLTKKAGRRYRFSLQDGLGIFRFEVKADAASRGPK
jgi:hypothetical protein